MYHKLLQQMLYKTYKQHRSICTINFETSLLKPCIVIVYFLIWQLHKENSTQKSSEENSTSKTKQSKYVLLSTHIVNQQGHRARPNISELLLAVASLTEKLTDPEIKFSRLWKLPLFMPKTFQHT